jgi:hypothetical protein
MVRTALLVLALASGAGAPHLGSLLDLVPGFWAGNVLDPNGAAATGDAGGHLDHNGAAATGDVGNQLDPNG